MTRLARSLAVIAAILLPFGCNKDDSASTATPSTSSAQTAPSSGNKKLVVIPKGTTHVFWQTVNAGSGCTVSTTITGLTSGAPYIIWLDAPIEVQNDPADGP